MQDKILNSFLERQAEEGMALQEQSDILQLLTLDGPPAPQHYLARFKAKGLVKNRRGRVEEANGCAIAIWLPDDYLRHADPAQILTYVGPHRHPFHPNISPPCICVHIRPGTPLVDLLYICYELWTWRLFATGDEGLNHAASQWARAQDPSRFPVDRRPLKRRRLAIQMSPARAAEVQA